MAYETELGNIAHKTDDISDGISAALVQSVVVVPLIYKEDLPVGTATKLFRKDGSLVASEVAESGTDAADGNWELTQATVSATAAKQLAATKLTVEAQQFGQMDEMKIMRYQGEAIARLLDDNVLALFDNFSNQVTATTILTVDDILQAAYTVRNALAGRAGTLLGVFDYKGIMEVQKEIMASGAAAYAQAQFTTLLGNLPATSGFRGSVPGVLLYETDGLPTASTDDVALVFNPEIAFAGMYSQSVNTRMAWHGADEGMYDQIDSWVFSQVVEWNDAAGCGVKSDT